MNQLVAELGMSFDQIVCTRFLHHLPDPDEGLKALRGALKVDGALHLMVYEPYGQNVIYLLMAVGMVMMGTQKVTKTLRRWDRDCLQVVKTD
jgi:2-polyprenyl-3-methyl-5-hydroxy-6-metoxy-1,4-benzoquinol methylase